jgi:hypothetical protein
MATIYHVRKVCETETGGKNFHYFREDQVDTLDPNIACPTHPTANTRDFVIEGEETT